MSAETHRFQLGDLRGVVINDGYISNIPTRQYFGSAPEQSLEPALRRHGILKDTLAVPCNCLLVDIAGHRV